jgi:uncharacterized Fe-S cluster protein YjdI
VTERKGKAYRADGIVVYFDPRLCIHAQACVHGLPAVFDRGRKPWIAADRAAPDEVAAVVARCPTGALHFERTDGGPAEAEPEENVVNLVPNGPLYVRGSIVVMDSEGNEVRRDTRVALCRCGQSKQKPFCDNSHVEAGFRAE